ncbi:Sec-independent protein translocase protein TatB [Tatumella sp. UBA2305]|uniref:Sec-independent protein translocase protein TatB n=1 Tax=Tatumella sp. UBA2305 TaxID=1947647 RepID=UPI0025CB9FA3|nr:Sec-independent protein translocase protein TatB [Tatumella sp. UBA2305]
MFDIGFSELLLIFVIGLIVLGPQRLPVAVKTVVGWIRAMRSLAANVQNELAQELKLQELQDSLKKVEEAGKGTLSPELKESMDELRKTAESMKRTYREATDLEGEDDKANTATSGEQPTIHQPATNVAPEPVNPPAPVQTGTTAEVPQHPTHSSAETSVKAEHQTASSVKTEPVSDTKPASPVSEER